ncbi:MAG TPA: aminoglycoside phosphotransferase family protein, partial [Planctomycetota bacterium]|nr:aminoglycoside phosphotransferase family protein [Planctomycetota bacterium]
MELLKSTELEEYLQSLWGPEVHILRSVPMGKVSGTGDPKGFGYGVPLRIDVSVAGRERSVVLETLSANSFGHEHRADRAGELLWSHAAYNGLPRHARSLDVG